MISKSNQMASMMTVAMGLVSTGVIILTGSAQTNPPNFPSMAAGIVLVGVGFAITKLREHSKSPSEEKNDDKSVPDDAEE